MSNLPFEIIDPIPQEHHSPEKCPTCGTCTVELFDEKNKPQNYKYLVQLGLMCPDKIMGRYDHKILAYFRCKICNKKFNIDWTHGPIPLPLINPIELFKKRGN